MIKTILWDFDGVILDSMPVRDAGFEQLFHSENPEAASKLLEYHKQNGGLSRYHKINYYYTELLKQQCSEELIQEKANEYSKFVEPKLINQELLIHETVNFIKSNYQSYSFHIVSGSDEKELNRICEKLKLSPYFKFILGSPTTKIKNIENLIVNEDLKKDETILIGDSINDYEAAISNNIHFLGYNNSTLKDLKSPYFSGDFLKDINQFQHES